MSTTAQELEKDITQMEDRLANVKVAVEVERDAWRRSSRTGKNGTKWKGAAQSRKKENELSSSATTSANNSSGNDDAEGITLIPGYWDALELAQYLKAKELGNYAQVVVGEQITGKMLLDTPAPKLRKLFENAETDPSWKFFQKEYANLKKHQRRFEKTIATNRSQPDSARSLDLADDRQPVPSAAMSSAGASLVFPLISPRVPDVSNSNNLSQMQQQNHVKPPTASKPTFPLRKPASTNNLPMATCWNCKTRFFRPHTKRPVPGISNATTSQSVSSSMRASLVARAYCSIKCQESIESSDIRISPSLSARVNVTVGSSYDPTEEKAKRTRPPRVATGLASSSSSTSDQPDPGLFNRSDSFSVNRLGGSTNGKSTSSPPPRAKQLRKAKTFARRPSLHNASLDDPNSFDFLHVAAPRRDVAALNPTPQRQDNFKGDASATMLSTTTYRSCLPLDDANALDTFSLCASVTSLNPHRYTAAPGEPQCHSPTAKPVPPTLVLRNSVSQRDPKQSKTYQQSKYKLDPDLYQAHQENFSSCFGAVPLSNRANASLTGASRVVEYGRGNLLRLQEFLTVRALYRLSLLSRTWYDLIMVQSAFSDALWGVHVLRIWRASEEDDDFLLEIGVLKKPERPRRMLQILTRQVSRVMVENMKVLLNPESWQLATVMEPQDGEDIQQLHKLMTRKRDRPATWDGCNLSPQNEGQHRHSPAGLYEQITVIYTRAGEIVAVCARQLIRPVDPMALLTDVLQGLKSGELSRVNCRRLRLFSQTNRLAFDQWALLAQCNRSVVEFFWSGKGMDAAILPPPVLPVWHLKVMSKVQHALQQRLLGKDSVNYVVKAAHDQNAPAAVLRSLEKFLARCHTQL